MQEVIVIVIKDDGSDDEYDNKNDDNDDIDDDTDNHDIQTGDEDPRLVQGSDAALGLCKVSSFHHLLFQAKMS